MYRHIWAEIDLDALNHNIDCILKLVPADRIMGVIKANAYGHGAGAVYEALAEKGVKSFAVSNVYEALDLRTRAKEGEILILGNVDPVAVSELIENNITVCIFDTDCAKRLSDAALSVKASLKCHIKLDSGMGRLGFDLRSDGNFEDIKSQMEEVFSLSGLDIRGAFTHFATADRDGDEDADFTAAQYDRFKKGSDIIGKIAKAHGKNDLVFHCANSAATLLDSKTRPSQLYRAGIVLYGLTPSVGLELPCELKAVMSLKATVSQVKTINKGESVSYGRTFVAPHQMRVATVTAGYADGYMRNLSNKGYMLIKGQKAPILGRVCMDQTVIDVSNIDGVASGDTVTLFGDGIPVEELAKSLGTINYELVCAVAHRVPRVYIKNGNIIDTVRYHSV